jgi:hypothetical protein
VPYGTAGYQKVVAWVDPFGGDVDVKDNRYWITSVDHSNNESAKSTMLKESEPPAVATVGGINLFWLILVWWSVNKGDNTYKVYRSTEGGGFTADDDKNLLIDGYKPSFLVDTGTEAARAASIPPFLLPAPVAPNEYYYKVVAKTFNSHFAVPSSATGGITPVIPGDDDLPPRSMSKLLLDYDEIQVGVGIDAGTVNITGRLVELEAQTINLDATGNVNLSSGGSINLTGGRINVDSDEGIVMGTLGSIIFKDEFFETLGYIRPYKDVANTSGINITTELGKDFRITSLQDAFYYTSRDTFIQSGRNIYLMPSETADSQLLVRLAYVAPGVNFWSDKHLWKLYVDPDGAVRASFAGE